MRASPRKSAYLDALVRMLSRPEMPIQQPAAPPAPVQEVNTGYRPSVG